MKKVICQYWEESERGKDPKPDGCSIHIDMQSYVLYIGGIYEHRKVFVTPDKYDRIVGDPFEVKISDDLYKKLKNTLRLSEVETNNLIKLKNIKTY